MASYRDYGYNGFLIRSINASDLLARESETGEVIGDYTELGFTYDLTSRDMALPSFDYNWNLPQYSVSEVRSMFPDYSIPNSSISSYIGQLQQFWKWIDDELPVSGASETGFQVPTNFTDVNSVWSNETNAYASNNTYATCAITGTNKRYLKLDGFDFSAIPAGATITGVAVAVEAYRTGATPYAGVNSLGIGLVTITNNDQLRYQCQYYPTTETTIIVGENGDLWGGVLTRATVQDSDFGVTLAVCSGLVGTAYWYVDSISMNIYYTT